jgi:hypothetical protein
MTHVFALCLLVGLQFAPRIPDLKHRRLYSFAKPSAYSALEPMIAARINVKLIRAHWSEIGLPPLYGIHRPAGRELATLPTARLLQDAWIGG